MLTTQGKGGTLEPTHKIGIEAFPYYVGIGSLSELATREDRVCVLNILGNESRVVTPVSHSFSGGNVVFGTSPGRQGQILETAIGDIPIFDNVRAGRNAGLRFNTGVVYLPPPAVRDGVAELVRVNPEIKKIIIVTEKVAVHDAREIRAICQARGVDVIGANSLGVADSWNQVRIGGALGGDNPGEVLRKGSIAIYSNSGNFTNTIATYLTMAGWGTTTLISSGKDVFIHYAAPEFAFAMGNDDRTKAAVMYVEPGGYYEQGLTFSKPVVACVVGRWKTNLTRAVGHAGALAGTGDDAESKEKWFLDALQIPRIFQPEDPVVSVKGAVVTNIADVPKALTTLMQVHGIEPDFTPQGDLFLKAWFGNNQGLQLPTALDLPVVEALAPFNEQIKAVNEQLGAIFIRQSMKDSSGASRMDAETQITSIHGESILDSAQRSMEANIFRALVRINPTRNDEALTNIAVVSSVCLQNDDTRIVADAGREAGNAPNLVVAAACSLIGPNRMEGVRGAAQALIDLFGGSGLTDASDEDFDFSAIARDDVTLDLFFGDSPSDEVQLLLDAVAQRRARSTFLAFLQSIDRPLTGDAVLAAITTTLAWPSLMRKRISIQSAVNLPWMVRLMGTIIGASVEREVHTKGCFLDVSHSDLFSGWSLTELAYMALTKQHPDEANLLAFRMLIGLLISNGPGTISAQGAKGAVAADGPETPSRVQLNKAMVGFLTHTGFSHGGNGFEGIDFLIDRFEQSDLEDPGRLDHGIDLEAMASAYAQNYGERKKTAKELGYSLQAIPGINHPVFRNKAVNQDPRETFISGFFAEMGVGNVFLEFYHALVKTLHTTGITRNVFCVNIDAVIAAMLLRSFWPQFRAGKVSKRDLETAAFTAFVFGRMIGCAAEIDDHMNRGRNMDTRTAASQCQFVS